MVRSSQSLTGENSKRPSTNRRVQTKGRLGGRLLALLLREPGTREQSGRALESIGIPVSLSHRILPEFREYERTSTVVINAYLVPLMSQYLSALADGLESVVRSSLSLDKPRHSRLRTTGYGLRTARHAIKRRIGIGGDGRRRTGARDSFRTRRRSHRRAARLRRGPGLGISSPSIWGAPRRTWRLCRGDARTTNEALVAGLPVAVPVIDIHTVGAGGGSIARVDAAGALRVGPESAGADPGPACYGRGEEVTVTDANLVLGRFGGNALLGGEMTLDVERAKFIFVEARLGDVPL